jgi:hypothetical protein
MSDNAVHFYDAGAAEQEAMGVETGFDATELFVFVEERASAWRESTNLNVQLLRALCQLSINDPQKAKTGFTSRELVEAISRIRNRPWSDVKDKAQMSDDIRQQWNKLQKTWENKSEGIGQQLSDAAIPYIPKLAKTEGGGTGNLTRHRIEWEDSDVAPSPDESVPAAPVGNVGATTIRYVCEDIQDANLFARIFTRGYFLKGWRKYFYIAVLAVPLLFAWLMLVHVVFGITWAYIVGTKDILTSLLSLGVMYWALWTCVGPLYPLGVDKIVIAPWWMQSTDEDRLLERRGPPRYPEKSIKAVRYVAPCPICGGRISATKGRLEFFGRIVGRCEEAPVEHVFSFDHVTRNGRCLR